MALDSLKELASYVFEPFLLQGALTALRIAAVAMVGGVILGLGLALARLSRFAPLRWLAWSYIWFVRGTPQLLQLVFIYDALPLSASGSTHSPPPFSASPSTKPPSAPKSSAAAFFR